MGCPTPILIAFGSNLDPLTNLYAGLARLHQAIGLAAISTVYCTKPLGIPNQPDFLNGAVLSHDEIDPLQLKQLLREIEAEQRRERCGHHFGPRTLDLDIALMGDTILTVGSLIIPDPDIPDRPFLVVPLAELAPTMRHPRLGLTLAAMAAGWTDRRHPNPLPGEEGESSMRPEPQATTILRGILARAPQAAKDNSFWEIGNR